MMLLAIIYLMFACRDTSRAYVGFASWTSTRLKIPFVAGEFLNPQTLLFFAFSLAFAIKVPMFPFHTWLPDAHVEAPTPGSVILSGRHAEDGFVRISFGSSSRCLPKRLATMLGSSSSSASSESFTARSSRWFSPTSRKLVAYSSVSHMGYVIIGLVRDEHLRRHRFVIPNVEPRCFDRSALLARRYDLRAHALS